MDDDAQSDFLISKLMLRNTQEDAKTCLCQLSNVAWLLADHQ
jgi:hypothetical protein